MVKTTTRHDENQRRIASYTELPHCFRDGNGLLRIATEEDYRNTLQAEGFAPCDPTDDELRELTNLPFFVRRDAGKGN